MQKSKILVAVVLLMQGFTPLFAPTPAPGGGQEESPWRLWSTVSEVAEKVTGEVRAARSSVRSTLGAVLGSASMFYEDHVQPVTSSYLAWASDTGSSLLDRVKTKYTPFWRV